MLKVRREAQPEETLTVRFGETVHLPFLFPHAGTTVMEIELVGEDNELTLANNRVALQAEGVRENLRVLLVSGEPHAGERTWRNLLRSDASVDLVHFTILRPPEKQDGTPINQLSLIAFPTRELFSEKLSEFDLIIFDRYQRRGVLPLIYLDNVARYVEDGGAVLVAAGSDYASDISLFRTPLGDVLPAQPTGRMIERPFRPMITETGMRHPVTANLPGGNTKPGEEPHWGRWFRVVESTALEGNVLMNGPDNTPLLVLSRRGKGRVATFLSDHVWLWARGYEGGGPHSDLLRRLSHWLMKEPDLEEEYLKATADRQGIVVERHSMKDEVGEATVTTPTDKTRNGADGEDRAGPVARQADGDRAGPAQDQHGRIVGRRAGRHGEQPGILQGGGDGRAASTDRRRDRRRPVLDGRHQRQARQGPAAPRHAAIGHPLLRPELAGAEGPRGLCGARRAIHAAARGLPGAGAVPRHHHPDLVSREPLRPAGAARPLSAATMPEKRDSAPGFSSAARKRAGSAGPGRVILPGGMTPNPAR